jgi:hypothetical protein
MPNVGSNEFKVAKETNDFVSGIPMGKDGTSGGPNNDGWKYGIAVYAHNGTDWVEVWNARPEMISSTITASSATVLSFTGTADPNNFSTTASFELREVGGSYTTSNTTNTGLGNNVDGAVGYAVTATVADTYKNWEVRAKGVNAAGTDYGTVLTLDCRTPTSWAAYTDGTAYYDGGDCKTRRLKKDRTYTKTGCYAYLQAGGAQNDAADTCGGYTSACYENGVYYENTTNGCGTCGYYTTSGYTYARKTAGVTGPCDGTLTVANADGGCRENDAKYAYDQSNHPDVSYAGVLFTWGCPEGPGSMFCTQAYNRDDGYADGCDTANNYRPIYRIEKCAINSGLLWITKIQCLYSFGTYP